jgi:hypothetical protein
LGYGWIRIRLLLPKWIPNDIEQRDYDLLCHDYIHSIPEQDDNQQQQQQQEEDDQQHKQDETAAGTESSSSSSSTAGSSRNSMGSGGGGGDGSGVSLGTDSTAAAAAAAEDIVEGVDDEGEIELDAGGVLVEVFEEAIDGLQELFDVLLESAA